MCRETEDHSITAENVKTADNPADIFAKVDASFEHRVELRRLKHPGVMTLIAIVIDGSGDDQEAPFAEFDFSRLEISVNGSRISPICQTHIKGR